MKLAENKKNIILAGPPNSGKTSLFNWLTGFRRQVVNYPGSTAILALGGIQGKYGLPPAAVIDTPGIYSLFPKYSEESAARDCLLKPDIAAVIAVLDASKLESQLPLFFQLKEAGRPLIAALTMWDLIPKNSLDIESLKKSLGAPAVPIKGLLGGGVSELADELRALLSQAEVRQPQKTGPQTAEERLSALQKAYTIEKLRGLRRKSKEIAGRARRAARQSLGQPSPKQDQRLAAAKPPPPENKAEKNLFLSEKFDRFFLRPKTGFALFALIMFSLFSSLFWAAAPFMAAIDSAFSFVIEKAAALAPGSLWLDFAANGLFASFGAVLVFTPQIFILFAGISLLEDTGYLARGAALIDGLFSRIGLSGRAFVPFLSGYACAIPAAIAARQLSSPRERLMTLFAIPFMSCSARLPVYALLLSFLFYGQAAWKPGLALSLIYIGSFALGALAVFALNLMLKKESAPPFLLDLPIYRRPAASKIFQSAYKGTEHYIRKAGPAIFTVAVAIWALTRFPFRPELSASEQIQQSYAGAIGRLAEPFFEAMGLDWRAGVGLIAAFAAREVFVSALALVFNIAEEGGGSMTGSLIEGMQGAVNSQGEMVFTGASAAALIVFFMFSLQCLSTTAIVYKESRSLKFASLQLIILNGLAYAMAVLTYNVLA